MIDRTNQAEELQCAFAEHDRKVILDNVKVGCWIGMALMPAGVVLDWVVYRPQVMQFLILRLVCSGLIAVFLKLVCSDVGERHPRKLGVILAMFPASFITIMIYVTTGAESPYYAGLNLVLLVIGFVLYWTLVESLVAVSLVVVMYVIGCLLHGGIVLTMFGNNLYFLVLTGIIVVVGSHFHSKSRFREFALRYQLDHQFKELQAAEVQLVQSEKLASLGRMSAGLIHEINNPLNYAKTGLYTIKKKGKLLPAEQQADFTEIVSDVEDGLNRVVNIVSDLRSFSHHDDSQTEDVDAADMIATALRFVSHEWTDKIKLEQNLASGLKIAANKNKLIQVCTNLLENSLDALKTKAFPAGESPLILITSRLENNLIKLAIRDNGPGIPASVRDKIFDPFFTTQDVGEGMGLGLSICRTIIQQCGGEIVLQSEPGQFTEFTLEFPVKA